MGNQQPKKNQKATKGQIDIACLKAKIHLELMRDRKHGQIIKGEKQLVGKIRGKSRNKVEELLIGERVVNGLKYAQCCNLLMSCAVTLRGHALFLADNQNDPLKMQAWLPFIYSLIYGADHLGLSSLNQFKSVLKALNDPVAVPIYTNPEIIQLLTANPTPEELNMYMIQFSERNEISLEEINIVGHKFTKEFVSPEQLALEKQLAEQMQQKFNGGSGGQGFNGGQGQGGFNGSQGQGVFNGGQGQGGEGQGGFNGGQGQGGFNGGQGQGGFNGGQGQGGFNGGQGQGGFNGGQGQGGFNGGQGQGGFSGGQGQGGQLPVGQGSHSNPYSIIPQNKPESSPYSKIDPNLGPNFHMRNTINNKPIEKPKQFTSYEDILNMKEDNNIQPIYPSIDPQSVSGFAYKPAEIKKGPLDNPFARNSIVDLNNKGEPVSSPTISQILRDFK